MFPEVGFSEMILIGVVALLVVGPKDLPMLLKKLGEFTRKMRMMATDFKSNFEDIAHHSEIEELRKEINELRNINPLNQIREEINSAINQGSDYYHSKPSEKPQEIQHITDEEVIAHNQAILDKERLDADALANGDNAPQLIENDVKDIAQKTIETTNTEGAKADGKSSLNQ